MYIYFNQALLRKYNNYIKDLEKKLKEKELEKKPEAIEEMQRLLQEKDMKIHELKEQLVVSSDVVSGRPENSLTVNHIIGQNDTKLIFPFINFPERPAKFAENDMGR